MEANVYRIAFSHVYECPHCQTIRTLEMKPNRIFCRGVNCEMAEGPHFHMTCHGCGFQFCMDTAVGLVVTEPSASTPKPPPSE